MPFDSDFARPDFPTTSWSMILNAAPQAAGDGRRAALGSLCEAYWYPLYAFARRRGLAAADARDLTQDFFVRILEGRYLDRADRQKGKFRGFLLTSFRFFLSDEADRAMALKRGGGGVLPFDVHAGEERYQREPRNDETPERIYERRWAMATLERAVARLRQEFEKKEQGEYFDRIKGLLTATGEVAYADLARELGTTEGALRVTVHRLRKRFREVFRIELAATVADPADLEEEIRFLASSLLSG